MSINTWVPEAAAQEQSTLMSTEQLTAYVNMAKSDDLISAIENINAATIDTLGSVIKQELPFWENLCGHFSADDIIALIRFFTVAEEKHSALFAGKSSCVIALNKLLKQQHQQKLSKEDLLWIRTHSSNRFIPNGSAL